MRPSACIICAAAATSWKRFRLVVSSGRTQAWAPTDMRL